MEGGETAFPQLGLAIAPRKGSALLWPNVYDHDLVTEDHRTTHEARPPVRGYKFGTNLWLHQYDFRTPNRNGCSMDRQLPHAIEMRQTVTNHVPTQLRDT